MTLSDQRVAVAVPDKPTEEPLVVINTPDAASRIIEMPKARPSEVAKADPPARRRRPRRRLSQARRKARRSRPRFAEATPPGAGTPSRQGQGRSASGEMKWRRSRCRNWVARPPEAGPAATPGSQSAGEAKPAEKPAPAPPSPGGKAIAKTGAPAAPAVVAEAGSAPGDREARPEPGAKSPARRRRRSRASPTQAADHPEGRGHRGRGRYGRQPVRRRHGRDPPSRSRSISTVGLSARRSRPRPAPGYSRSTTSSLSANTIFAPISSTRRAGRSWSAPRCPSNAKSKSQRSSRSARPVGRVVPRPPARCPTWRRSSSDAPTISGASPGACTARGALVDPLHGQQGADPQAALDLPRPGVHGSCRRHDLEGLTLSGGRGA